MYADNSSHALDDLMPGLLAIHTALLFTLLIVRFAAGIRFMCEIDTMQSVTNGKMKIVIETYPRLPLFSFPYRYAPILYQRSYRLNYIVKVR